MMAAAGWAVYKRRSMRWRGVYASFNVIYAEGEGALVASSGYVEHCSRQVEITERERGDSEQVRKGDRYKEKKDRTAEMAV